MEKQQVKGIKRLIMASKYSWQGYRAAYQHEEAFRQEVWLFIIAIPLSLWLADNAIEWILLIGSIILLMIVELLNSAIEATIDRIGSEFHTLSGRAKDMGSGAVLLAIGNCLMIWLVIILT